MGRRSRIRERQIADAVQQAGRSELSRVGTVGQGVDLSPDASRARAHAARRTGRDGGWTGRELVERSDLMFARAKRLAKIAQPGSGRHTRRRAKADRDSDELLRNAAAAIRLAELTPLDRGYLHALTLDQVQIVKAEVGRAFDADSAALAVDTHRRITHQRERIRREPHRGG